ncbi:MAG TPA: Gfo/Idh/MocA family oxidoreductase, partial [Planctomycetota bacterium]|nr:Gfo/Idh/MocA family oxidoreductase [Planctomycetota bacterium]
MAARKSARRIRYGVVGLGNIAQVAVLPAFANARNSECVALFSSDAQKLKKFGRKFGVKGLYSYEQYDEVLARGEVDAVYIALPNAMHRDFTVRAAAAGVHVLCEKPMDASEAKCLEMIRACEDAGVKLMIAYRLHFEEANLKVVEVVKQGKIGEPRLFTATFTMQVREGNDTRLQADLGASPMLDLGVYCLNAARYVFRAEPVEVFAYGARPNDGRFDEVVPTITAVLRFPGDRLAQLTASFATADCEEYRVIGEFGDVRLSPCFSYEEEYRIAVTIRGKTREKTFSKSDQFGPELVYFSDCILEGRDPEPSGREGLADVRAVEAILRS